MTSTELERVVREKLKAAGLSEAIDEHGSQFLEFPDGLFAELVLNDGSKLVDVERVARELRGLSRSRVSKWKCWCARSGRSETFGTWARL